jgi:hypothetical protein
MKHVTLCFEDVNLFPLLDYQIHDICLLTDAKMLVLSDFREHQKKCASVGVNEVLMSSQTLQNSCTSLFSMLTKPEQ